MGAMRWGGWRLVNSARSGGSSFAVAPPSGFPNPGKILINPDFLYETGNYAFLNLMKASNGSNISATWLLGDGSGILAPGDTDANGYPTVLRVGSGVNTETIFPDVSERPLTYVARWTGNGTIGVGGSTLTGGSFTGSGGFGRAAFTISAGGQNQVSITTLPVTNLAIFHAADETDYLAGKITGVQFRNRIAQAKFPVFRILNWGGPLFEGANGTNQVSWSHRKPAGYVSYAASEFRSALFAGTTTGAALDYALSFGSGAPTDKQVMHLFLNQATANPSNSSTDQTTGTIANGTPSQVLWTAHGFSGNEPIGFGNNFSGFNLPAPLDQFVTYYVKTVIDANHFTISATPGGAAINTTGTSTGIVATRCYTLNLNATGAVPIRATTGQVMWSGYGNQLSSTGSGVLNLYTAVYEASTGAWLMWPDGLANGVPVEVFIQFCAELGCHPWFIPPFLGTDPMSDWTLQCATYCKANAPSWMIPRFETCNEPWNIIQPNGNFPLYRSFFNWGAEDLGNFLGKIGSTVGQDVSSVYGSPDGTKYHLITNIQTGSAGDPNLFNSPSYVGQGSAQSGYILAPAKNYLTHITMNTYFQSQGNYTTGNSQWAAAVGAVAKQAVVDGFLATGDLFLSGGTNNGLTGTAVNNSDGIAAMAANVRSYLSFAGAFSNSAGKTIGVCGYEGGFNGSTGFIPFVAALKNGTNLQSYYTTIYQDFLTAGGVFPAEFQLTGAFPSNNVWSVLETVYQSPDPPQWNAIVSFNH
jgi:hypothetical protein